MLKYVLQGKPFGHPLHPALIHFPIALFLLSLVLDVVSLTGQAGDRFVLGSFYALLFGIITALLAAVPGFVDYLDIRRDHPARKVATYHMILNLTAVALYAVKAYLRYQQLDAQQTPLLPFLLSLAGIGILTVSGYLGGHMVYNDGIAVGRHRRPTPTPADTLHAPQGVTEGEWVAVKDAQDLGDRQTLRVEVNGTVLVVARQGEELFAFQEFCTHRYGPLSEGAFVDGQIECPWHRSCFDLRTGRVTQGPAKVDLKTFEVRAQDGQIQVRVPPR